MHEPEDIEIAPLGADVRRVRELIRGCPVAFLTTTLDGTLESRPMATHGIDNEGNAWFFTQRGAPKVQRIRDAQTVGLAWPNVLLQRWVTATGVAEIVDERTRMTALWRPSDRAWFPEGLESPDLALLKVALERVEYWSAEGTILERTANVVRTFLVPSGTPRAVAGAPGPWVHGRLELRLPRPELYSHADGLPRRGAVTHAEEERHASVLASELEPLDAQAPVIASGSADHTKKRGNGKGRKST